MFPYVLKVNNYQVLEMWPNSGNSEPQTRGLGNEKSQNVRIFHTSRRKSFEQPPERRDFPDNQGMSGTYFHVGVKVTFTEVSFEHAWIEVSVSICVQSQ